MLFRNQLVSILSLLFALGVVVVQGQRDGAGKVNWNQVTDTVIQQFKGQIMEQDQDEVSIPDLNKSYNMNLGWIFKGNLSFSATHGHLGNISSIQRISDVILRESGNYMTFTAFLKFGDLKLRYEDYSIRFEGFGIGPRGSIAVHIMDNSVQLRVRVDQDKTGCSLIHEDVEDVTLNGIKLKVTGLGPLNERGSKVATWLAKLLQNCIKTALHRLLRKQMGVVFENIAPDCTYWR